jgi:acyl-coenzyme A thioesterase PaaI-like protein
MEKIHEHGSCFVCGKTNTNSIGVEWCLDEGNQIDARFAFTRQQQGPPGFVHGGASAAVLDEAMGLAVWYSGYRVVTVNLVLDYRKPVPLGEIIQIHGAMSGRTKRRIEATGKIFLPDGTVAVIAKGIYVEGAQFIDQAALDQFGPQK